MNATTKDIAEYLEDQSSMALSIGTNLFIGREPSIPNDTVTIFDTSSIPPQLNLVDQGYEYPAVQIRVRNVSYEVGWRLINSIKALFHGLGAITINGTYYSVIYVNSGPALLDWDENSRARFILNLGVQRRS